MKVLIATIIAVSSISANANTAETLLKSNNCLACHNVDRKVVGPSFKEVAAKYTTKDVAKLAASIRKGGGGKWGAMPMPAYPKMTQAESEELAKYILNVK